MCRYGVHTYKEHFACVGCRKAFRKERARFADPGVCPHCGGPLQRVGRDFHAPRRRNRRAWRTVTLLLQHGIRWDSCGCGGPGYRPTHPRDVAAFVAATQEAPLPARRRPPRHR
jgi:hypothetical protein